MDLFKTLLSQRYEGCKRAPLQNGSRYLFLLSAGEQLLCSFCVLIEDRILPAHSPGKYLARTKVCTCNDADPHCLPSAGQVISEFCTHLTKLAQLGFNVVVDG